MAKSWQTPRTSPGVGLGDVAATSHRDVVATSTGTSLRRSLRPFRGPASLFDWRFEFDLKTKVLTQQTQKHKNSFERALSQRHSCDRINRSSVKRVCQQLRPKQPTKRSIVMRCVVVIRREPRPTAQKTQCSSEDKASVQISKIAYKLNGHPSSSINTHNNTRKTSEFEKKFRSY